LHGFKFRRQHPIGPFIADFACAGARLVVELDGGQHCDRASDARRTAWLETCGWRAIRFWNNDVLAHPDYIIETILRELRDRHIHLSRLRERSPAQRAGEGAARTTEPSSR